MDQFNVAVIGCGDRSRGVVSNLRRDSKKNVKVISVFDPDTEVAQKSIKHWECDDAKICKTYQETIDTPGVDWVMVFSPNTNHCEHVLYSFAKGKNVFSEKPLATSIEDCQKIHNAHLNSGRQFATGFVLRYSPLYRKAKEILDSGLLGKLLSINADENIAPDHGGYIMRSWRRFTALSGPHILEKCCHDLDLIEWFCNSLPSRVASFAKRDFFIPENDYLVEKYGSNTFHGWNDPHATGSAFTIEKDLMDNQVAIVQFRNNILVQFQATMSNTIPERRMLFNCTEGTMFVELYTSKLVYKKMGDKFSTTFDFGADGHGGGDNYITKELYECMCNNTPPKCSGSEGLESAVFALALDRAAQSGQVFDLEPIWKTLNR